MENRETKKPNDPLLCRKKEALKCQKNTDNEFEKEKRKKTTWYISFSKRLLSTLRHGVTKWVGLKYYENKIHYNSFFVKSQHS